MFVEWKRKLRCNNNSMKHNFKSKQNNCNKWCHTELEFTMDDFISREMLMCLSACFDDARHTVNE